MSTATKLQSAQPKTQAEFGRVGPDVNKAGQKPDAEVKPKVAPLKKPTQAQAKPWIIAIVALVLGVGGYYVWQNLQPTGVPPGIAVGNGRIESTQIDIATKIAGRIKEILVDEGAFVTAGQAVAHMDVETLEAQKREAEANLQSAIASVQTAQSVVKQREAERATALALVTQREVDVDQAQRRLNRSLELAPGGAESLQTVDDDRSALEASKAGVAAAQAQVAQAVAAINAARSDVMNATKQIDATRATIERIQVDINDSTLRAPRDGRVQYRVAEPGEVLPAGGRVLNYVDLADVYMTFYLPTEQAGRVATGAEARIVLDAMPEVSIPAHISYVADVAQFTPKTVETPEERLKLVFEARAQIPEELLRKYIRQVKTGLPGVAYVKLDPNAEWPEGLPEVAT
jgi:HlyD family secretion protein